MIIRDLTKLTDERWINLFAVTFENRGHTGRWVFASRKPVPHQGLTADAVVMVPVLRNPGEPPRLVLIREFRVPVGGYMIGFPAGLIDPGETAETTARREMAEETGLTVTAVKRVTQPLVMTAGLSDEAAALAFVDVTGVPSPQLEASESIDVLLLDYDAVVRLCDDASAVIDVKVWTVLWMYRALGRIE
ncbi:MAG: NUDIX domain-containing protein [Gemmataceae bacterium]